MATISELTEDFEGGTAGAVVTTANSFFTSVDGIDPPLFTADAIQGGLALGMPAGGVGSVNRVDFPAAASVWLSFYLKPLAAAATNTAILTFYDGNTVKVGDLRITTGGTALQLRSINSLRHDFTALTVGEWHRVEVHLAPTIGGTGVMRCKVYSGANLHSGTPSQDSGDQTAHQTSATVSNFRFGRASADTTLDFVIDRVRGDTATAPAPMVTNQGPTANAGPDQTDVDPFTLVTLDGSASSDPDGTVAAYAWTQTAGDPVTLSDTSTVAPSFTAPASLTGGTLVFELVVTDSGGLTSAADTVTVTVLPHSEFVRAGGGWVPADSLVV